MSIIYPLEFGVVTTLHLLAKVDTQMSVSLVQWQEVYLAFGSNL
jgi:hypothetical protein